MYVGSVSDEDSAVDHPTDAWLSAVAHGTMETYVKSILEIPKLNDEASQQLATDIGKQVYMHMYLHSKNEHRSLHSFPDNCGMVEDLYKSTVFTFQVICVTY